MIVQSALSGDVNDNEACPIDFATSVSTFTLLVRRGLYAARGWDSEAIR